MRILFMPNHAVPNYIQEFFNIKDIYVSKEKTMSLLDTIIKEPVVLNAADAAMIVALLVYKQRDRNSSDTILAVDLLTRGSESFREK